MLVAIDGHGGAGKSSLARRIARSVEGVTVVCLDDFARPSRPGWDRERFCRQVLLPLLEDRSGKYQRWNWVTDHGADWRDVPVGGTLVVEGVSATTNELGRPWDLTIWVDASEDVRLRRGVERDGEGMRQTWEKVWIPAENAYVASQHPQERVDLIVNGCEGLPSGQD